MAIEPLKPSPIEPTRLVGCADKIQKALGWKPSGTFDDLVREMVNAEVELLSYSTFASVSGLTL